MSTRLVGRAHADDGLAADDGRTVRCSLRSNNGAMDRLTVVTIYVRHYVPAIGFEALRRIVGEPTFDVPVNGDPVVIVEDDQLAEAERPRQRARLVRDAFHQAPIANEHVSVVIEQLDPGPVELIRQQ